MESFHEHIRAMEDKLDKWNDYVAEQKGIANQHATMGKGVAYT